MPSLLEQSASGSFENYQYFGTTRRCCLPPENFVLNLVSAKVIDLTRLTRLTEWLNTVLKLLHVTSTKKIKIKMCPLTCYVLLWSLQFCHTIGIISTWTNHKLPPPPSTPSVSRPFLRESFGNIDINCPQRAQSFFRI